MIHETLECVELGKKALNEQIIRFSGQLKSERKLERKITMSTRLLSNLKIFSSAEYLDEIKLITPTIKRVEGVVLTLDVEMLMKKASLLIANRQYEDALRFYKEAERVLATEEYLFDAAETEKRLHSHIRSLTAAMAA